MYYLGSQPSWSVTTETPCRVNFVFWLRRRTGAAPPLPAGVWLDWAREIIGIGPAPRPGQDAFARYPALAAAAEREFPRFEREWDTPDGPAAALGKRIAQAHKEARLHEVLAGSDLQLHLLYVDHAGDLRERIGDHTWLLGEAQLDPGQLRAFVAGLRRHGEP